MFYLDVQYELLVPDCSKSGKMIFPIYYSARNTFQINHQDQSGCIFNDQPSGASGAAYSTGNCGEVESTTQGCDIRSEFSSDREQELQLSIFPLPKTTPDIKQAQESKADYENLVKYHQEQRATIQEPVKNRIISKITRSVLSPISWLLSDSRWGMQPLWVIRSAMKLDNTIVNNGQLMAEISVKYGEKVVNAMLLKHPPLRKPNEPIDPQTLDWFLESYSLSDLGKERKVAFSPFKNKETQYGVDLLLKFFISQTYPRFSTRQIFLNHQQFNEFRLRYTSDNYKEPSLIFKEYYYVDSVTATEMAKVAYEKLMEDELYYIGLNNIDKSVNVIKIYSHGLRGGDHFYLNGVGLPYKEVVDMLVAAGLKSDLVVELNNCYSACGSSSKLDLSSTDELREKFIDNKLLSLVIDDYSESIAYKFTKEFIEQNPNFCGKVVGFAGVYAIMKVPRYIRDQNDPSATAIKVGSGIAIRNKDSDCVFFDKAEMKKEFTRDIVGL